MTCEYNCGTQECTGNFGGGGLIYGVSYTPSTCSCIETYELPQQFIVNISSSEPPEVAFHTQYQRAQGPGFCYSTLITNTHLNRVNGYTCDRNSGAYILERHPNFGVYSNPYGNFHTFRWLYCDSSRIPCSIYAGANYYPIGIQLQITWYGRYYPYPEGPRASFYGLVLDVNMPNYVKYDNRYCVNEFNESMTVTNKYYMPQTVSPVGTLQLVEIGPLSKIKKDYCVLPRIIEVSYT